MELAIQTLLKENGHIISSSVTNMPDLTPTAQISPETYLGSARMQYYFPGGSLSNGTQTFSLADNLTQNSFSYGGTWTINSENAVAGNKAVLNYNFSADKVYIILRPGSSTTNTVKIYLDGKVIDSSVDGADVHVGTIMVDLDRLYNLVDLHGKTENHVLKLEFQTPGIQAYTFTFG